MDKIKVRTPEVKPESQEGKRLIEAALRNIRDPELRRRAQEDPYRAALLAHAYALAKSPETVKRITEQTGIGATPIVNTLPVLYMKSIPALFATELVKTIPLSAPKIIVPVLKRVYGTSKGSIQAGYLAPGSYGGVAHFSPYYSSGYIDGELHEVSGEISASTSGNLVYTLQYAVRGPQLKINIALEDGTGNADAGQVILNSTNGWSATPSITAGDLTIESVSYDFETNQVTIAVKNNHGSNNYTATVRALNYYATYTEGGPAPEFNFHIAQIELNAQFRKLKTMVTAETLAQLQFIKEGEIPWENEILTILSQEVRLEIDRWVLNQIIEKALDAGYYSSLDVDTSAYDWPQSYTLQDYKAKLVKSIFEVARNTLLYPANWVVMSPVVAGYLFGAPSFISAPTLNLTTPTSPGLATGQVGIEKVGTLTIGSLELRAYVDTLLPDTRVVLGHFSGEEANGPAIELRSGAIFGMFVPAVPYIKMGEVEEMAMKYGVYGIWAMEVFDPAFYYVLDFAFNHYDI